VRCTTAHGKKYWVFSNKASEIFSPPLNFLARACGRAVFVAHFLGSNQKEEDNRSAKSQMAEEQATHTTGRRMVPALQLASQAKIL
jgi:hypothetical protein